MCGHGGVVVDGVVVEGAVVEAVVVELGAVVDDPDGVLAAPDVSDPIPSPNPNAPPATPTPSRILPKGFISHLPCGEAVASPVSNVSTSALR